MRKDLQKKLLEVFRLESEERINSMSASLLNLEKNPSEEEEKKIIETIFREAHSLKGASRAVELKDFEEVCHRLETLFSHLKNKELTLSDRLFDILHQAVDTLNLLISSPETKVDTSEILDKIKNIKLHKPKEKIKKPFKLTRPKNFGPPKSFKISTEKEKKLPLSTTKNTTEKEIPISPISPEEEKKISLKEYQPSSETVRISTSKLDSILLKSEELLSVKLIAEERASELRDLSESIALWKKEWSKSEYQVKVLKKMHKNPERYYTKHKKSDSNELIELLDQNKEYIDYLEKKLVSMKKTADTDCRSFSWMVDNLMEEIKKTVMFPFSSITLMLPKMVRDISKSQGKNVELTINGSDVELDRRILEEIKNPLIHLLRNSIDHGIESPEERTKKGKEKEGKINIKLTHIDSNKLEIDITDNGSGINFKKIKDTALKKKIISREKAEEITENEIISLIFEPHISTNAIITDISGRGLGLAIVKESIEKLGGNISVKTGPKGTSFKIYIPVTMATFRGSLIEVSGMKFIIPTLSIERVLRLKNKDIKQVEKKEAIIVDGKTVYLASLCHILELEEKKKEEQSGFVTVLLLSSAEKTLAFKADNIITEQEVLVKKFGRQLTRVRNISGATILGSGKIVPILNVSDLIKSALKLKASYRKIGTESELSEEGEGKKNSILIAEDSITSRMLLKNILEAAGYDIKTAVDGAEAYRILKEKDFNLVVSDIEMPGLDGFELTKKIRTDKKLSEMPVILVTSLSSREDKEKGIDAGADAYIVKTTFDQSNLLEVVKKTYLGVKLWLISL